MAHSGNLRSIVAMLLAVGCFSLMDTVLKLLVAHYAAMQVAALRGLSALPLVLVYVAWLGEGRSLWRVRWPLHLARGAMAVVMLALFAWGLRSLPLAEAYTIFFIAPLLITVLSILVLKEKVARAHWLAIAAGLGGVLVALRPSGDAFFSLGALAVLAAASCYAVSAIVGRLLTRSDSSVSLVFWTTALLALGAGVLAAPQWAPIRGGDWPLILGLAVTGFLGQVAITEAFRHGQASVVAPFEYTALAWGIALDWTLWHTLPDRNTLLGGAIIIASGLYLVRREQTQAVVRALDFCIDRNCWRVHDGGMKLSPTLSRFVIHWGEMGTRWGVNRTVAQIHALLYISGRAMHAEEIADTLEVARSNVSNSLRELQGWSLVRLVHLSGDRRDHFETSKQVWELLRTIVRERQRREIAPTIEVLREVLADPAIARDPAEAKLRMQETLDLLETLTAWSDEMLKLDADTLTKVLKLGAKIKKLLST